MAYNSDNFDLSKWNITLPIDASGKISGTAKEIENLVGAEDSKYFFDSPDGAMTFHAIAEGATTSGSHYARSELREMVNGTDRAAWHLSQGGTMTATLKVDGVPSHFDGSEGREVIGQIHGKNDELVRLYYDAGKIYFVNDLAGSSNKETTFVLKDDKGIDAHVNLGQKFSYMIDAHGSTLSVKALVDGHEYSSITKINSVWQSDSLYFKAGVYLGINETNGKGEGQTSFYALDFSHEPGKGLGGWDKGGSTTGGNDTGTGGHDTVPSGNDTGTGGHDTVPSGNDTGTGGHDTVPGGNDTGTGGNDTVPGGNDTGTGGVVTITLDGDAGNNTLTGGSGNETLWGRGGNDSVNGGDGNDYIWGNEGDDTLNGGLGSDTLKGGNGADTYVLMKKGAVDTVVDFSVANHDKIDATNVLKGLFGFKHDSGFADGYISTAQNGKDVGVYIDEDGSAGAGAKHLVATLSNANLAKIGADSFILPEDTKNTPTPPVVTPPVVTPPTDNTHALTVYGTAKDDELFGAKGDDVIKGQSGNDILHGDDGRDFIWGNEGNDTLIGGHGADTIKGGDGTDTFVYTDLQDGGDVIQDFRAGEHLDIHGVVANTLHTSLSASQLVGAGYVTFAAHGATTDVIVDADGAAGAGHGVLLATLTTDSHPIDASILIL